MLPHPSLPLGGQVVLVYIHVGKKLLYPHLLMEEFFARNRVALPSLIVPALCFTVFLVARIIIITVG
jgi:hypothetical protein